MIFKSLNKQILALQLLQQNLKFIIILILIIKIFQIQLFNL